MLYMILKIWQMCFSISGASRFQLSIIIDLPKRWFGTEIIHLEAHLEKVPVIEAPVDLSGSLDNH
jgi:hypothetical protein